MNSFKMLNAHLLNCTAEIYINGIPLSLLSDDDISQQTTPVNQYIVPGENIIGAIIYPGPRPKLSAQGVGKVIPAGQRLNIRLLEGPGGAFSDDADVALLGELNWAAPVPEAFDTPIFVKASVMINDPTIKRWAWQDFPPLTLDGQLMGATYTFLQSMVTALNNYDTETFLNAARPRFFDNNIAYGLAVEPSINEFRESILDTKKEEQEAGRKFTLLDIDIENTDLRLCAGKRMIDCKALDWQDAIHSKPNPDGFADVMYPMQLAMINGQLKIIR